MAKLKDVAKMFAFLAFNPKTDSPVREYIISGGLFADSGPNILVFFVLDEDAAGPVPVSSEAFGSWLSVQGSDIPAYRLLRFVFEPDPVPPIPGLVFFSELGQHDEAVYVPLADAADAASVQRTLRVIFSLADHAARIQLPQDRLGGLRVALRRERIKYTTTRRMSLAEWLVRSYQFVSDHAWDIATLIKP